MIRSRDTPKPAVLAALSGGILSLTLNRPEQLNAISKEMLTLLERELHRADVGEEIRVVTLTGAGRAFCSGGDLAELPMGSPLATYRMLSGAVARVMLALRSLRVPLIVGLNGVAVGGGASLALAGDVLIAADSAEMSFPWVKMGLVPDSGATALLRELVGTQQAKRLLLGSEKVGADALRELGVVAAIVPGDALPATVAELAERMASAPSAAVELTKNLIDQSGSFGRVLESEALAQAILSTLRASEG